MQKIEKITIRTVHIVESTDLGLGGLAEAVSGLDNAINSSNIRSADQKANFESLIVEEPRNNKGLKNFLSHIFLLKKISKQYIKKTNPSVVHIHGIWMPFNYYFSTEARSRKIRIVVQPHGMLSPWGLRQKFLKKTLAMWLYQRRALEESDLMVATCEKEFLEIRSLGIRVPVAIIPNGYDQRYFYRYTRRTEKSRTMVFLSRLHPKKGLRELIEAWSKASLTDWKLLIIGSGDATYLAQLEELLVRLKIGESVRFLGAVYGEDKWDFLASADFFILPSHDENFGIAILEALSCGTPVITTLNTPWRMLREKGCGWSVQLEVNELAETLRIASLQSQSEWELMSINARNFSKEFGWRQASRQLEEAYLWLFDRSRKPDFIMLD